MAPASRLGRGKPLKNQTKEVLRKLHEYFAREIARDPRCTVRAAQLVVHATGVSLNALRRALAEPAAPRAPRASPRAAREAPRPRRGRRNIIADDFDAQAVRRVIHGFYCKDEEFPIMNDLHLILKADVDYQGSLCSLRRHVAKLGFRWVDTDDNSSVLIERHDVRFARVQYLTKIEAYRNDSRNIVYVGEISLESSRASSLPRADGSSAALRQPARTRLSLLLAGGAGGLLAHTLHALDARRDARDEGDAPREGGEQHERWYRARLLPALRAPSVVVVDGGSAAAARAACPAPHAASRKREMLDWLSSRNIPHSPHMYKPQLYRLVQLNRERYADYKLDAALRERGHTVLRVPPNHPDLNPVTKILATVRDYVGSDTCLNAEGILKVAAERVSELPAAGWREALRLARAEEEALRGVERAADELSERAARPGRRGDEPAGSEDEYSEGESADSD